MSYGVGLRNGVAFALGTIPSLTSGGGLRPSLLLNFLSGSLDSRITFSRGTQATQYTSNGTLQYAPNNLLTYSNQADNAAWTKSNSFVQTNLLLQSQTFDDVTWSKIGVSVSGAAINSTIAPDGTSTADSLVEDGTTGNHWLFQTPTGTTAATNTFSCYIKAGSRTWAGLRMSVTGPSIVYAWFNLATGTTGTVNAGLTASITSVGNGWYRCSVTGVLATATPTVVFAADADNSNLYAGVNGSTALYLWGAQLVQGSVPGDYVATTSAALPVLYADYQGKLRARKLCEDASVTVGHQIQETATCPINAYTTSIYAKAGERTKFALDMSDNLTGDVAYTFDLVAGTASSPSTGGSWSNLTASITSIGNGWYRCSISALRGAGTNMLAKILIANAAGSVSYTGDGSSGIYIADAQLEAGSTVQAYNDTTSAAYYGPRFDYDPTNYVRQNLLTYSEQFDNAIWTRINATVSTGVTDPNGGLSAATVTSTAAVGNIRQTLGVANADIRVNSIWMRRRTGTGNINFWAPGVATPLIISALPTTWTRYSIADVTAQTARTLLIELVASGDAIDIAFAQLNTGSTALTYTATTTAPYTLVAARGLLIEEQRQNLLLQSNDFQTSWTPTNITRTLASTTGPDGTLSGVKIAGTAAVFTELYQDAVVAATSATASVYVKLGTGATIANSFGIRNVTTATNLIIGTLNYSTGVWTYSTGSTGVTVTNVGNGWWRLQISATASITSGDTIRFYVGYLGATPTAGDFLYAYGAQLEAGAFATSYIPTVGSQVTRSGDNVSMATVTPWFNQTSGTIYAQADTLEPAILGARTIVAINDGTASNFQRLVSYNGKIGGGTNTAGVLVADLQPFTYTVNTPFKFAYAYATNDFAAVGNGGALLTDNLGALPTGLNTMGIGLLSGVFWCGHIQSISYYPTRLPNATLQGLTV